MTDFHVDYSIAHPQTQHLQIVISLISNDKNEINSGRYRKIKPVWIQDDQGTNKIIYRLSASRDGYDVTTRYAFLDREGNPLPLHHSEELAQ